MQRGEEGSNTGAFRYYQINLKNKRRTRIELLEKNLAVKKNELVALNEKVPNDVQVTAKKQMKNVEVPTGEKNLFGKPKTTTKKKPTGNVIVPEEEFETLISAVKENKRLKGNIQKYLATDLMQENMKLGKVLDRFKTENINLKTENVNLKTENQELKHENRTLRAYISDLIDEIGNIYKTTKEFLKERTENVKGV